jgi:hypothetical protein
MMHVRRAPREVYRVYSEDEFFGGNEPVSGRVADERVRSAAGADQRWHTAAGVTIVAAALGAIGGVVALTWVAPPPRGGRRAAAGLLAAAGSLGPSNLAGTSVWRERSNAASPRPRGVAVRRVTAARARRRAGTPVRAVGARRSPGVLAREQDTQAVAMTPAGYEVAAVSGSGGSTGTVSPPGAAPRPSHPTHAAASEFGFER